MLDAVCKAYTGTPPAACANREAPVARTGLHVSLRGD